MFGRSKPSQTATVEIPATMDAETATLQALDAIGTMVQSLQQEVASLKTAASDEAIAALKAEHTKQLDALKAENESLKAKITSLESQPAASRVAAKAEPVTETTEDNVHPFTALAAQKLKAKAK